jgi:hypothetical protein
LLGHFKIELGEKCYVMPLATKMTSRLETQSLDGKNVGVAQSRESGMVQPSAV